MTTHPRRYVDAEHAGVALGLVLLASYLLAGRGIGASGAFAAVAGRVIEQTAPSLLAAHPALQERLPGGAALSDQWIVWQVIGLVLGAMLSARIVGRARPAAAAGPARERVREHVSSDGRAVVGGMLMGIGARLAYGCTSGLALSGGALLATGAWIFIGVAFATAFLVASLARTRTATAGTAG